MIDRDIKRSLGQMMKGVQVVASSDGDITRAYCSHWVSQVSFEEPIVLASISPKHDTHAVIKRAGWFSVSNLAADQVEAGQYFSYPGRKFKYIAPEFLTETDGVPYVPNCISWLKCDIISQIDADLDHDLFLARVVHVGEGRIGEPPLLYSSRLGWRVAGGKARQPGDSVRDRLVARLEAHEATEEDPPHAGSETS